MFPPAPVVFSPIITSKEIDKGEITRFFVLKNNTVNVANTKFSKNYLNIEVKLHTNMNNLNIVYVIKSQNIEEFKNIKK